MVLKVRFPGIPSSFARSHAGKCDLGLRTFTTVGELLWYYCFPVCGCLSGSYGIWFITIASLLLSRCGFSFVFGRGVSFFGGFQHPPVGGCSTATSSFGVLTRDECTSYSASLYLDFKFYHPYKRRHILQHYSKLACKFQNRWLCGEFPGGPVVRTQRFHCSGPMFNPWLGN